MIKSGSGEQASSGSGFVVWSGDGYSLIATNAHVIEQHLKSGSTPMVDCVFNSGQPNERSVKGEIHGVSQLDDLALLKVYGLTSTAKLEADGGLVPSETQRVYAAGFPFGQMLAIGDRNPNLTITETSITSIRQLASGMPEVLQTSGGIDLGNSGGPVIDADGRLVGVSVARIRDSSIGFAIPAWKVQELLPSSLSDVILTKKSDEKKYRCSVNLTGLEHSGQTQMPELVGLKYDANQSLASKFDNGSWSSIPGLKTVPWSTPSTPNDTPFRRHTVLIDLETIAGSGDQFVFQWRMQTGVNRKSRSAEYRYSRPMFISREDIADVENAMKQTSASPSAAAASGQAGLPDETILKFDAYIRRCIPAGGGRYLVLSLSNGDIVTVDLATKQQVATTNEPSANILVAGKTSVVAFNKAQRSMTTFRLPDLESLGTKTIRDSPIVRFADWGADTSGPIVAVIQPSGAKTLACRQSQRRRVHCCSVLMV